jgi:hypothetical protein
LKPRTVFTMARTAAEGGGQLQKRFSKITMVGMAFAILKYVIPFATPSNERN